MNQLDTIHQTIGIAPVADAFAGTVRTDVVSMKRYSRCDFIITQGVGTTGTSTITVNACDDFTPSNRVAIPFKWRIMTTNDAWGAWTEVAATGIATTAGSNHKYQIAVRDQALPDGYPNVELTAVEVVDSPVLGCVDIILSEPRFSGESPATAIA